MDQDDESPADTPELKDLLADEQDSEDDLGNDCFHLSSLFTLTITIGLSFSDFYVLFHQVVFFQLKVVCFLFCSKFRQK